MNYTEIKEKLKDLPEKISEAELKIMTLSMAIDDLDRERKDVELNVWKNVCEARGEDGKNLFTNDKLREVEQNKILKESDAYLDIVNNSIELSKKFGVEKIMFARLKRELKSIEILVEILKLE